jgi:hypothetical protein
MLEQEDINYEHKHSIIAEGRIPPRATDYASTIESDVPIVVQHPGLVPEETAEAVHSSGK